LINNWHFPKEPATGYIWDAFIDKEERLALLSHKDGLRLVTSSEVKNLTRKGQGPGEMEHWAALFLTESHLIDIENSGKLIYFKKDAESYAYDKTEWLTFGFNFPYVKGAVFSEGKWYLAGFCPRAETSSKKVSGYFLSIYENGKLATQLFDVDFKTPVIANLITAHIRLFNSQIWMMLASEPEVHIYDVKRDSLLKKKALKMPEFYRGIRGYLRFEKQTLNRLIKAYEDWELSYSRIENFLINDKNLIVQVRTADRNKPRFGLLFFDAENLALEKVYFCNDLLLTEKDGCFYFFENGDPGFDEEASCVSIKIYRRN
jgi:hypothetical protein